MLAKKRGKDREERETEGRENKVGSWRKFTNVLKNC